MTKNSETHIDWKEEIAYIIRHDITHVQASNSKYKNQLTAVVLIKYFTQLLADARREVINKVEKMKKNGWDLSKIDYGFIDQGYNQAIDDVLATLREEEK